jgi:hypothetical protein
MSHIDVMTELSDAQAVTSTAISTNVIERDGLGLSPNATQQLGAPAQAYFVVQTVAAATDSGSDATLAVTLESATNAALSGSPVVHLSSGTLAFADFSPAGTVIMCAPLPYAAYKDYIGARFTVGSGPLTAGTFNAYITLDPPVMRRAFDDGRPVHPTGS